MIVGSEHLKSVPNCVLIYYYNICSLSWDVYVVVMRFVPDAEESFCKIYHS